jgi:hypothetical protein
MENKNAYELYNRQYRFFANAEILCSRVFSVFCFNYHYIYYIFSDLPQRESILDFWNASMFCMLLQSQLVNYKFVNWTKFYC